MDRDEFGVDRRLWFQILMELNIGKGNWINCISSLQWKSSYTKKQKNKKTISCKWYQPFSRGEKIHHNGKVFEIYLKLIIVSR